MRKWTSCFFLLSVFSLFFTGCQGEKELGNTLWGMDFFQSKVDGQEILTMDALDEYDKSINFDGYFESIHHGTYAYDLLSEAEKLWYEDINNMLGTFYEENVRLSPKGLELGLTEKNIDKVYQSVLIDHPEYFFVEGYEYIMYTSKDKLVGIEISGTYPYSLEEGKRRKAQIDSAVQELLQKAPVTASDYEKIKYVYETLIFNTEYELEAADNQNIYSVFVNQASVCQGYSKATQYLLQCLGVDCTLVFGEVKGNEGHSWNLVVADGEYYYLDTTWGDASYITADSTLQDWRMPNISYDYMCITTEQLTQTHEITHKLQLPECNAVENNYYRKEGFYFTEFEEEHIKGLFLSALEAGKQLVTLKCSSQEVYDNIYTELLENQRVFEYLPDTYKNIAYIENEQQLSLTFWMTN